MPAIHDEATVLLDRPMSVTMNRMIRLLQTVRPSSDAEALRMLRGAFPQSSLAQRIAAIASRAG